MPVDFSDGSEIFSGHFLRALSTMPPFTHYLKADFIDFEPEEGHKRFAERDLILNALRQRNITVEGRPLFWMHSWVTPEWLKKKSYPELIRYLDNHIQQVIRHYGDQIEIWEVVNEMHDWANETGLTHDQTINITRFACEKSTRN